MNERTRRDELFRRVVADYGAGLWRLTEGYATRDVIWTMQGGRRFDPEALLRAVGDTGHAAAHPDGVGGSDD